MLLLLGAALWRRHPCAEHTTMLAVIPTPVMGAGLSNDEDAPFRSGTERKGIG
jgi:hypothetical protein